MQRHEAGRIYLNAWTHASAAVDAVYAEAVWRGRIAHHVTHAIDMPTTTTCANRLVASESNFAGGKGEPKRKGSTTPNITR